MAVSFAGVLLIHVSQYRQYERRLYDRASTIARAVVHAADMAGDPGQLQRFVTAIASEPDVTAITVVAGEPLAVVAASTPEWRGLRVADLPDPMHTRNRLERTQATSKRGWNLDHDGHASVEYTLPLRTRLRPEHVLSWAPSAVTVLMDAAATGRAQLAETGKLITALLSTIGVSCVATYFLLHYAVIRPVRAISAVAGSTVVRERKSRVGWWRQDELGHLGLQFDRMLEEQLRREETERQARSQAMQAKQDAEQSLSELRCLKYALDEHAIVAITSPNGTITYVNDLFCRISQYSRDELIGATHALIKSGYHRPEFWKQMWMTIGRGQVWHNEICNRAKDGSLYWVDTTVVPIHDMRGGLLNTSPFARTSRNARSPKPVWPNESNSSARW